ncbi:MULTISPECIES: sulfotransferase family protein [unclassified Treponema]|uniref:sulfotransferase family protein n=1 Tax=unclassified Treponema TaxID=2638727 RepID=UPI0020A4E083|nr:MULTISPECIES: sulfotransferase family protein [unclassified Treponema]
MPTPTIIGTSSFAQSGGSALTNVLEEFESIYSIADRGQFECKFFTDNILPLEIALKTRYGIDNAIKSFLFNAKIASLDPLYQNNFGDTFYDCAVAYIDSISDWYLGAVHKDYDYSFLDKNESKMFKNAGKLYKYLYGSREYAAYEPYHWEPSFAPFGKVYYADFTDDFYQKTQAYIEKVFSPSYMQNKRYLLADAIYTATSTTPNELMYYKNSKALIANRDPRDLYVMNKEIYGEWFIPTWDVDAWIKYYKHRRQCIKPQKENNKDNILHIQFENLIYDYEDSLSKIKNFLDLSDEDHVKKGQIFIPEKSIQNTQMFRRYPKYFDDIKKIEKELPEFCYDYSESQIRYFHSECKNPNRLSLEDIRKNVCAFQKQETFLFRF